jgi:hypothetical protein
MDAMDLRSPKALGLVVPLYGIFIFWPTPASFNFLPSLLLPVGAGLPPP